jgi:tetratricopeptide (TPR) repeat protein
MSAHNSNNSENDNAAQTKRRADTVGYKRPPRGSRFKKGRSGNPKGRPKGRPNFANIVRDLINTKTKVQVAEQTLYMPTGEAIIRKLMVDATKGNHRSLMALLNIVEMTGRTDEVSDEERARRTLKLPKPKTRDEFDLVASPARAKERQRLLLKYQDAEAKGSAPQGDPDRILQKTGTYRSFVASINPAGSILPDPSVAAIQIGLEAEQRLYAGDFAEAVRLAEDAIGKSPDCEVTWMKLIVAHAQMFLGQAAASKKYYLSFQTPKTSTLTSWETVILRDFGNLRQAGHSHPAMSEIHKHFTSEGWTVKGGAAVKPRAVTITADDRAFMVLNPDDLQTGSLLEQEGEFDKAANLYRRNIVKCRSRLASDHSNADARQILDTATERLVRLTRELLFAGKLAQASEFTEELLGIAPNSLALQALRAQIWMFGGQGREARDILLQHRGKMIGSDTWEAAVIKDFEAHRNAGRTHALMYDIEQLFGAGDDKKPAETLQPSPPEDVDSELVEACDIPSGDKLFELGRRDEALAVYFRHLHGWLVRRSRNQVNTTAISDRDTAIERVCDLAVIMIQNREYKAACDAAHRALAAKAHAARANICLAHGLMFLGQEEEARAIYLKCSRERLDAERTGKEAILRDFVAIREADLTHSLMDEIERALTTSVTTIVR